MTRALSGTDAAQAASAIVGAAEFLTLAFPSGTIYLAKGDRAYTWGGNTYSATGQWESIGNYNEAADNAPRPMQLVISGVDATLLSDVIGTQIQWAQITYALGFTDVTGALLDSPSFVAPAFLGDCTIVLGENTGEIRITAENLLADIQNRQSGCLHTDADQKARYAGDTFYLNIASLINKIIYWGQIGPTQVGVYLGGRPVSITGPGSGAGPQSFGKPF